MSGDLIGGVVCCWGPLGSAAVVVASPSDVTGAEEIPDGALLLSACANIQILSIIILPYFMSCVTFSIMIVGSKTESRIVK